MQTKKELILGQLKENNLMKVRLSCISRDGLADSELRREIWPILLKIEEQEGFLSDWRNSLQANEYSEVIQRDVNRSLFGLDITENLTDSERDIKRVQLSNIINAVINKNPNLHYFQGFNSICSVFLLIGGEDLGFKMSYQCAELFIKDSMRKSFDEGVSIEMFLIYKVLEKIDKRLSKQLQDIYTVEKSINSPMFSLSWVLTWLSHNMHSFEKLCRIFDFCLASHPLAPVYIAASIILTQRESIMKCSDMPEIHQYFHDLVSKMDVEEICEITLKMMIEVHPSKLVELSQKKFHDDSPFYFNREYNEIVRHLPKQSRTRIYFMSVLALFIALAIGYYYNQTSQL